MENVSFISLSVVNFYNCYLSMLKYEFPKSKNYNADNNNNLSVSVDELTKNNEKESIPSTIVSKGRITLGNDNKVNNLTQGIEINTFNIFSAKRLIILFFIIFLSTILWILLYKFSPVRFWIRRKIEKIKFLQKYICNDMKYSYLSNAESKRFNIEYNSSTIDYENYV
ncbi:variable surface protein [Plasmodium gonderi]|uniref:Variable surface protein n=1 Tax=Plasmodium gonderi TaxID=77519 RepID=A0A1Y1JUG8_PLAGO|nr:variable surface protein [Plasmodium gonderi]GAW84053.1 variable surface protein [Plasmodium gonderi]